MAILQNLHNNNAIKLYAHHLFGRKLSAVDSCLAAPDASQIHAAVRWNGFEWHLEDLSRNGTWINQRKLLRNKHYALQPGAIIQFGRDHQSTWQVQDVSAPVARLESLDGLAEPIPLTFGALLPSESQPELSIFQDAQKNWVCESKHGEEFLEDGQVVTISGISWRFRSDSPGLVTRDDTSNVAPHSNSTVAVFHVSQNEEHVSLALNSSGTELDLGERIHHYLLLTLARQRLDDLSRGLDSDSQGWIDMDRLTRMIGIDDSHTNIQVYRARRQVMKMASPKGLNINIVERRSGCLRFGLPHIQVMRGSFIENESIDMHCLQSISA